MDSLTYFLEVRNKYYKMKIVEDEIKELEDLSRRAGAMDYSKEYVQTGEEIKEPAFVKALDKVDEKVLKYRKLLEEYTDYRSEANDRLYKHIKDGLNAQILYLKFFKFMTLEQISRRVHLSFEAVRARYRRTMRECDRIRIWEDNK